MSPVVAVMLIAICRPDLVHCRPVESWESAWESVELCNGDRPLIEARVTARVEAGERPDAVVMTKCRLFLDEERIFDETEIATETLPIAVPMF